MKVEQHKKAIEEHLNNIKKAIDENIENNQRNLGFNISQGAVELFSLYLHKLNLIGSSGDNLDHRIFKNKNLIEKKLPLDFPFKNEILELMKKIELERIALCYGSRKPRKRIEEALNNFNKLKNIIEEK